jgi:hypothetical protein
MPPSKANLSFIKEDRPMPVVADYAIVSDEFFTLDPTKSKLINFTLPDLPHEGSRRVLMFTIDLVGADDLKLVLKLNGSQVWSATYNGGAFFSTHEVIPKGFDALNQTQNQMLWLCGPGDGAAKIGDIVIFYQHQI